jgi:hypothetical protein
MAVREVVVLAAGLPDEAMPDLILDYDYHTGLLSGSVRAWTRSATGSGADRLREGGRCSIHGSSSRVVPASTERPQRLPG